jgi:hypothetical protein
MNTNKILFIICILANQFINSAKAQAPQSFNYQAVARDTSGALLSNQAVNFRISLLQGSTRGTSSYTEIHSVTTNLLGLVNFGIGGGIVVSGNFATINWAQGPYFAQVELDAANNGTYVVMSTTQLLSVPYAKYAEISGSSIPGPQGPAGNGYSNGTSNNQIMFWNGTAWAPLNPGSNGQTLTICNGSLTWTTGGICPGSITSLNCAGTTNNGNLIANIPASGVSSSIPYTGGNGGTYSGQTLTSSGVTGLTATLLADTFAVGSGNLTYSITGTPNNSGIATFGLNIGGQTCSLNINIAPVPNLGSNFQGGKIIYIFQAGDSGYIQGEVHGLIIPIAAISTTTSNINNSWGSLIFSQFGCQGSLIGNTSTSLGSGIANTNAIIAQCNTSAAKLCDTLSISGYSDWFLPSKNEVAIIYQNYSLVGGVYPTQSQGVWSSSEINANNAWVCSFDGGGGWISLPKDYGFCIKPLRKF